MVTPTPEQMLEKALMAASKLLPQSLTRVCSTVLPLAQMSLTSLGDFPDWLFAHGQKSAPCYCCPKHLLDGLDNTGGRCSDCGLDQQCEDCEDDRDLGEHVDDVWS